MPASRARWIQERDRIYEEVMTRGWIHLARRVHDFYFNPQFEEFAPRTRWSLANAFTSAFKELDPIPQFKATAKLGSFFVSPSMLARTEGEISRTAS